MTSSPHGLYVQGYTRATMGGTKGRKPARGSQSHKTVLSSDCSLQLDCMKLESLVIVDQHATVNTPITTETGFLGLAPPRGIAALCTGHCSTFPAPGVRAMRT